MAATRLGPGRDANGRTQTHVDMDAAGRRPHAAAVDGGGGGSTDGVEMHTVRWRSGPVPPAPVAAPPESEEAGEEDAPPPPLAAAWAEAAHTTAERGAVARGGRKGATKQTTLISNSGAHRRS